MKSALLALLLIFYGESGLAQSASDQPTSQCYALERAIDSSLKDIALERAEEVRRGSNQNQSNYPVIVQNELTTITVNVRLMELHRCKPIQFPIEMSTYALEARACVIEKQKSGGLPDSCIRNKWNRTGAGGKAVQP